MESKTPEPTEILRLRHSDLTVILRPSLERLPKVVRFKYLREDWHVLLYMNKRQCMVSAQIRPKREIDGDYLHTEVKSWLHGASIAFCKI